MPCDSIQLNQIDLKLSDWRFVEAALKSLGCSNITISGKRAWFNYKNGNYEIRDGKLVFREGQENIADEVKRAYSKQIVRFSAKQAGWKVIEKKNNRFELIKA